MDQNERVVGIDGRAHIERPVTQLDFAIVARLQAAAWNLHTEASVAALELGERIARHAEVEVGEYYFDAELRIVRTSRTFAPPPPVPQPQQEALDFDGRKEPGSAGPVPSAESGVGS